MKEENNIESYIKKMKMLIPHWIDHNSEHIRDHNKWLRRAEDLGFKEFASELREVINLLKKANEHIKLANEKLK